MKIIGFILALCVAILGCVWLDGQAPMPTRRELATATRVEKPKPEVVIKPVIKGNVPDAVNLGLYEYADHIAPSQYREYDEPITKSVKHQYDLADADGNGRLDGWEISAFTLAWHSMLNYEINEYALTPAEFYANATGDCEDFAIWVADLCNYWEVPAYIAIVSSANGLHAVTMVKTGKAIDGFVNFYVADGTYVKEGYYIVIDYSNVGNFSDAIQGDWYVLDVRTTEAMYGLRI